MNAPAPAIVREYASDGRIAINRHESALSALESRGAAGIKCGGMSAGVTIAEIGIYPVKSLAGIAPSEATLERTGFKHDRRWMVVTPDGRCLTQRTHPRMALVATAIQNDRLVVSAAGMDAHVVPEPEATMPRLQTEVWGDRINAVEMDTDTNRWLSRALATECKLVAFPDDELRACDPNVAETGDHTRFADAFPLLVVSRSSLDYLNEQLSAPVGMTRFRPNIVVAGCGPHDEDEWRRIAVNGVAIRLVKPCARCAVPTVDPRTGTLAGPEPIRTLSRYRRRDGAVHFGMNAIPESGGILRVGDRLLVS